MKNKHLVLLFLAVLGVGLLARRLPWPVKKIFQTDLIEADTASMTQISVFKAEQPELLLERTEAGWVAAQENRSAPVRPERIAPVLAALSPVRSIRIVQTTRPDTLGFSEQQSLRVLIFEEKKLIEQFEIGNETLDKGQPATYIRLNRHEGIYLVENHLRDIFSKKLSDFRENNVASFDPARVRAFSLEQPDSMPFFFQKNDSTARWESSAAGFSLSDDSVQTWLRLFDRLNGSPFADQFDESRAGETLRSRITCYFNPADSLVFKLFYVKPPDLPEEISSRQLEGLPVYILHSSQNPANFFAPPDTMLLRRIFFGWVLVPDTPGNPGMNR